MEKSSVRHLVKKGVQKLGFAENRNWEKRNGKMLYIVVHGFIGLKQIPQHGNTSCLNLCYHRLLEWPGGQPVIPNMIFAVQKPASAKKSNNKLLHSEMPNKLGSYD
jgi:hypothetical protein